jgi:hypothetical protein
MEHLLEHRYDRAKILQTTSIKNLQINCKFKSVVHDALLGYFRASGAVHKDTDLITSVKDYL